MRKPWPFDFTVSESDELLESLAAVFENESYTSSKLRVIAELKKHPAVYDQALAGTLRMNSDFVWHAAKSYMNGGIEGVVGAIRSVTLDDPWFAELFESIIGRDRRAEDIELSTYLLCEALGEIEVVVVELRIDGSASTASDITDAVRDRGRLSSTVRSPAFTTYRVKDNDGTLAVTVWPRGDVPEAMHRMAVRLRWLRPRILSLLQYMRPWKREAITEQSGGGRGFHRSLDLLAASAHLTSTEHRAVILLGLGQCRDEIARILATSLDQVDMLLSSARQRLHDAGYPNRFLRYIVTAEDVERRQREQREGLEAHRRLMEELGGG